jgi:hypothetical protein
MGRVRLAVINELDFYPQNFVLPGIASSLKSFELSYVFYISTSLLINKVFMLFIALPNILVTIITRNIPGDYHEVYI